MIDPMGSDVQLPARNIALVNSGQGCQRAGWPERVATLCHILRFEDAGSDHDMSTSYSMGSRESCWKSVDRGQFL